MSLRTKGGPEGFVPFPADRAARYRSAGYWTGQTLDSVLSNAAQRWPTRIGVLDADTALGSSRRLSFAQLDERADRAAAGLTELGIAPGDRVLLQLPNGCEFAVALFALLRAGAIPVMCLTGHRAAE
ncbi:MAG: mycobactin salicyl-AMP ligase, partial [Mycobacterium sp.]|nr:mycobactin salicyl-AMP ligase [Mycobacterium sp.]